jgi:hypothetical protein
LFANPGWHGYFEFITPIEAMLSKKPCQPRKRRRKWLKKKDHFRQANGFKQGGAKKFQRKAGCRGVEKAIYAPL